MSMSAPIGEVWLQYLIRRPILTKNNWYIILKPFQSSVWICVVFSFICVTAVVWIYSRSKLLKKSSYEARYRSLSDLLLEMFAIQVETGCINKRVENVFIRYIFNVWTVYCYLISIAFSSGFVPHLTTPEYDRAIESVKDLVQTNHYWGMEFPVDTNITLNLNDPWDLEWSKRFTLFNSSADIIKNTKKDNFAIWGKRLNKGFILNENIYGRYDLVDYESTSFSTAKFYFAFIYRNGTPYRHAIDVYLCRLVETGIVNKIISDTFFDFSWKQPYSRDVLVLTKRSYTSQKKLDIQNLRGVFSGLIIGWIMSFFVIILELIVSTSTYHIENDHILYTQNIQYIN